MNDITAYRPAAADYPTVTRHWHTLTDPERRQVDAWTSLIPLTDCRAIVAELESDFFPAGIDPAKAQAAVLVGSYPTAKVAEPEIYVRAIVSILAEFPVETGKAAVDRLTRTLKFVPTRAEVFEACSNLLAQRRIAAWVAEKHLAEHARRREEIERKEALRRDRAENGEAIAAWMEIPVLERPPLAVFVDDFNSARSGGQ